MSEAPDYEHHGLVAEAWDLLRGDTSGWADRLYFRAIAERQGGPALDVGCGDRSADSRYIAGSGAPASSASAANCCSVSAWLARVMR